MTEPYIRRQPTFSEPLTGLSVVRSRYLKIARVISSPGRKKYQRHSLPLTSEQKRLARHAAAEGLTLAEIADIINWTAPTKYLSARLRENHIHFGGRYRSGLVRP
jgi:hypothetical protein